MSTPREVQPINLPAPTGGADFLSPLSEMGDVNSPWLENIDVENRSLKVRRGYVRHAEIAAQSAILGIGVYGRKAASSSNKLFAYSQGAGSNTIYNITTTTPSLDHTAGSGTADEAAPLGAASKLYFLTEADFANCNRYFDGASWNAWVGAAGGRIGVSYKNRIYIFSGTTLYYGALDAVTGVGGGGSLDLSTVFEDGGNIAWATVLSSPGERASEIYLAFGTDGGEVLVYAGAYPADATWTLIGRFRAAPPIGYDAIIRYYNDTYIITESGVVSLKDLFQRGSVASNEETASSQIDAYWRTLIKKSTYNFWGGARRGASGCYWPEENKIFILVPGYVDIDGNYSSSYATMFIMNVITRAWSWHKITNIDLSSTFGGLTYFRNNIYFFVDDTIMTYSPTLYKDEAWDTASSYFSYPFAIHGAYNNFGSKNSNKRIHGYEPILKTDFGGSNFGIKAAADFGRQVSNRTDVGLLDGYNIPYYSVGAEGTYLQYRLEGSSDTASTDGLEFFGIGALIQPGGLR